MFCVDTNVALYYKDLLDVANLYFGLEEASLTPEGCQFIVEHRCVQEDGQWVQRCRLLRGGETAAQGERRDPIKGDGVVQLNRFRRRYAKLCLYEMLKNYFGYGQLWGGLTGIRPTKLVRQLEWEGMSFDQALDYMNRVFDVSPEKLALVRRIHSAQQGIYQWGDDSCFDVYVGIPFCRTRCLYCSFFSAAAGKESLLEEYTDALCREIGEMGRHMAGQGKRVRTIYMGGGTPTALGDARLERVLAAVNETFGRVREFTVEAGRPDTVTPNTFPMLRRMGVDRVSINPQTMNARTLQVIGRDHTPQDIVRAYGWARQAGIPSVNMDMIVGLPGETPDDVADTLRELEKMEIDNLTVHTLAIKRSSKLHERLKDYALPSGEDAVRMLEAAESSAVARGMEPYYMYRQKYMRGNLENVGYALPGKACVYNVDMMEETHSILGLGAGSMSKRMFFEREFHSRLAAPKDVATYLHSQEQLLREKKEFFTWAE
ncbi:MAG: coproporphyrinogen dehydrogenase HemZ [Eubacteriales bacterium]|nr:coproporphyrinogen dehydrogenase HemZ [Eubacteriales bacterium]